MNNIKFGDEKKKGSFFLQIKHDFYKGTIEGWKRYAIALCIFVFLCFVFQIRAEKIIQFNKISKEISFSDFILFMFRGMNVFDGNAVASMVFSKYIFKYYHWIFSIEGFK